MQLFRISALLMIFCLKFLGGCKPQTPPKPLNKIGLNDTSEIVFGTYNQQNHPYVLNTKLAEYSLKSHGVSLAIKKGQKRYIEIILQNIDGSENHQFIYEGHDLGDNTRLEIKLKSGKQEESESINDYEICPKNKTMKIKTGVYDTTIQVDGNGCILDMTMNKMMRGNGLCTCAAVECLKRYSTGPDYDLFKKNEIDNIIEAAAKTYKNNYGNEAQGAEAGYVARVIKKAGLTPAPLVVDGVEVEAPEDDEGGGYPVASEAALVQSLKGRGQQWLAVLRANVESWAIICNNNGSFDLFDSHGKSNIESEAGAFIKRFTTAEGVAAYCFKNREDFGKAIAELNGGDAFANEMGASVLFWIKPR